MMTNAIRSSGLEVVMQDMRTTDGAGWTSCRPPRALLYHTAFGDLLLFVMGERLERSSCVVIAL